MFSFLRTGKRFSKDVAPFYSWTNSVWECWLLHVLRLLHILPVFGGVSLFNFSSAGQYVMIPYCSFSLHVENVFICLLLLHISFLNEMSIYIFCPLKKFLYCLSFYYWDARIFYIFWKAILCQINVLQISLLIWLAHSFS